mgnify:CR=1 FL=1
MDIEHKKFFNVTLADYGAHINASDQFVKGDKVITSVRIKIAKGRIRFENAMTDDLVMSGTISSKTIESFVTKFWYWEKTNER